MNASKKIFGIIGYPLTHSFSPQYFNAKFARENILAEYCSFPLEDINTFRLLTEKYTFSGLNVTIPYKQTIIPYLDEVDDLALVAGAVNTIHFVDGKTKGYNTDIYGFEKSLMEFIKSKDNITQAMILGTGGAARAVAYVLKKIQISYVTVSRLSGHAIRYSDISKTIFENTNLIINTTPLGMYPDKNNAPEIPYKWLNKKYFLYDLIYNPEKTIFLSEGTAKGCQVKNGKDMLVYQAEKAWEIWNQPE